MSARDEVINQIQWERDMAIRQLEDHGLSFGGKQSPMTLEDMRTLFDDNFNEHDIVGATVYVEEKDYSGVLYLCIIDYRYDKEYGHHVEATWNGMATDNYHEKDYDKTWRAWRCKPTKEELDDFPW